MDTERRLQHQMTARFLMKQKKSGPFKRYDIPQCLQKIPLHVPDRIRTVDQQG